MDLRLLEYWWRGNLMKKILLFSLLFLLISASVSFAADEPSVISFQGKLEGQSSGVNITFRLYDVSSGGIHPRWSETHQNVSFEADGIFNVMLGSKVPFDIHHPLGLFYTYKDTGLWLEVQIGTQTVLSPRQAMTAAPYAFYARRAEYAAHADEATNLRGGNVVFGTTATGGYPTPEAGMMAYNSSRDKVAVYDSTGSKWVEIDPVYTRNQIRCSYVRNATVNAGAASFANAVDLSPAIPNGGSIIITNIGIGRYYTASTDLIEVVVYRSGGEITKFYTSCDYQDSNSSDATHYTFPVPLKIDYGESVTIGFGSFKGYWSWPAGEPGSGGQVGGIYLNYIWLPL